MTNETTAPGQSLVDEVLADLSRAEKTHLDCEVRDMAREAYRLIRQQQAELAKQAAPVAVPDEHWTPADQQAFAEFMCSRHPGEFYSFVIQTLGSAWKDGQANGMRAAPTPPAQQSQATIDMLTDACEEALSWFESRTKGLAIDAKDTLRAALAAVRSDTAAPEQGNVLSSDIHQIAFEIGGTEDGEYHFDSDELDSFVERITAARVAPEQAEQPDDDPTPPEVLAARLISIWVETHGKPIPWAHAVRITGIAMKLPQPEIDRLLAMDDAAPEQDLRDAYVGAREDLAIWKRRALEAEAALRKEQEITGRLSDALNRMNGPTFMGEPALPAPEQAVKWGEAGTVGNLIAQLLTIDPAMPVYASLRVKNGIRDGVMLQGLIISYEHGDGRFIVNGGPEKCVVIWTQPDDRQAEQDVVRVPRDLLEDALFEADNLLDEVNGLLQYAGSTGEEKTHGESIKKLRALLGGGE